MRAGKLQRRRTGDLIECRNCGERFKFNTKTMRQSREFCRRDCYRELQRNFDGRPYPQIWHNGKREYLHRVIFLEANPGETLGPDDIVHHIDENPYNRDPSNLEKKSGRAAHLHAHDYHRRKADRAITAALAEPLSEPDDIPF